MWRGLEHSGEEVNVDHARTGIIVYGKLIPRIGEFIKVE